MSRQMFVNLPVRDLQRSVDFFTELGFTFNPKFTDETATCMIIGDDCFAMLLTHPKFREFMPKQNEIVRAEEASEVLVALSCESREEVDAILKKVAAAGGRCFRDPVDSGFMYGASFQDPDGHIWEPFWMDEMANTE